MPFRYEEAVPWGRSFDEYRRMFNLSDADLNRRILGCADGPASFNAAMAQRGHRVISCDPLYQFSAAKIQERIDATYETVMGQTRRNQDRFIWDAIPSPDALGEIRMAAMRDFLADYEQGSRDGRYIAAEVPDLPFAPGTFDLAVCSHFLFLYSDNFSLAFHQQAIDALCEVAKEVRIFPILNYNAEPSPHLMPIRKHLAEAGRHTFIETVPYEFQRGGNQMLRILSSQIRMTNLFNKIGFPE
ncbi:MAG: SAM-dependent methyltransferase [Chloroflexota bacterium]